MSRTATGHWKRRRQTILAQAQQAGQTTCPLCRTWLDYDTGQRPNSAEVDHITAHAHGGTDDPANLRVLCRQCNQILGGYVGIQRRNQKQTKARRAAATKPRTPAPTLRTSQAW